MRAVAIRALEEACRPWREAFVGGKLRGAARGRQRWPRRAPMGRASAGGASDLGPSLGLPALPVCDIVLFSRARSPEIGAAIRALAAGVRAALR